MGSAIGQVAGGIGSLFGGGARRAEEKNAQAGFDTSKSNYDNFQFQNNYLGLQNTAEDLTVNRQAANFQGQQTDQALSQSLDTIRQTGGGGGSAQAIANAALKSKQGISNTLASQEQDNLQARSAQAAQNQQLEAAGAERQQDKQFGRIDDQYGLAGQRLGAAKAARAKAQQDLIGGIAGVGSIVAGGLIGGAGFGANLAQNFGLGSPSQEQKDFNSYNKAQNTRGTSQSVNQLGATAGIVGGSTITPRTQLGQITNPLFKN